MKILSPEATKNPDLVARFQNEMITSYNVDHKNVIRTFEYIVDGDIVAFTMEYVEGGDLSDIIKSEAPLPIQEVVRLLIQVCEGLEAIHQAGVIHRDLKPENILITRDGTVRISDFGIARTETSPRLTEVGGLVGTMNYLSPEYANQSIADERSDIYSLGVLGYELITRKLPYNGPNLIDIMKSQMSGKSPDSPSMLNPTCPQSLSTILLRAIDKEPSRRFSTAREMRDSLELIDFKETAPQAEATISPLLERVRAEHLGEKNTRKTAKSVSEVSKIDDSTVSEFQKNIELSQRATFAMNASTLPEDLNLDIDAELLESLRQNSLEAQPKGLEPDDEVITTISSNIAFGKTKRSFRARPWFLAGALATACYFFATDIQSFTLEHPDIQKFSKEEFISSSKAQLKDTKEYVLSSVAKVVQDIQTEQDPTQENSTITIEQPLAEIEEDYIEESAIPVSIHEFAPVVQNASTEDIDAETSEIRPIAATEVATAQLSDAVMVVVPLLDESPLPAAVIPASEIPSLATDQIEPIETEDIKARWQGHTFKSPTVKPPRSLFERKVAEEFPNTQYQGQRINVKVRLRKLKAEILATENEHEMLKQQASELGELRNFYDDAELFESAKLLANESPEMERNLALVNAATETYLKAERFQKYDILDGQLRRNVRQAKRERDKFVRILKSSLLDYTTHKIAELEREARALEMHQKTLESELSKIKKKGKKVKDSAQGQRNIQFIEAESNDEDIPIDG